MAWLLPCPLHIRHQRCACICVCRTVLQHVALCTERDEEMLQVYCCYCGTVLPPITWCIEFMASPSVVIHVRSRQLAAFNSNTNAHQVARHVKSAFQASGCSHTAVCSHLWNTVLLSS